MKGKAFLFCKVNQSYTNYIFNVFHVRALYYTKTLITKKCTKSFINRNTLLHVSTLVGHLQGELFVIVTPRLHFIVE
jgi:hypothetical protein